MRHGVHGRHGVTGHAKLVGIGLQLVGVGLAAVPSLAQKTKQFGTKKKK